MVERLKASGVTIIYISHRMEDMFRLTDRITIMRDGAKIATLNTRDTNVDALVKLMVGTDSCANAARKNACYDKANKRRIYSGAPIQIHLNPKPIFYSLKN